MKKLRPYVLGLVVLAAGVAISSRVMPRGGPPRSAFEPSNASLHLRPVRVEPAPEALYFLVAEALVEKLRTGDLLLTVREYRELTRQTSRHLREGLGLELPPGYSLPASVPRDWLERPELSSMEDYARIQQLHAVNRDYLRNVLHRLLDEHASQTVQLMMERITAIRSFREPGDDESLSLVKALYGDHFANEYAASHAPRETKEKLRARGRKHVVSTNAATLSANEATVAEVHVSSLWRTEFRPEELPAVREYVLREKLQDRLREDLLYGVFSAAERGLMEKNAIGYRLLFLHDLTRKVLTARAMNL